MLFDPADFVLVNSVGASGLSLAANAKSVNGLFDPRLAPTQIAAVTSRLENAVRYLLTEKYASAPAAWYDFHDFSTLFQDAAGNIPVTAVGQPVGRALDKSGRGNHATVVGATLVEGVGNTFGLCFNGTGYLETVNTLDLSAVSAASFAVGYARAPSSDLACIVDFGYGQTNGFSAIVGANAFGNASPENIQIRLATSPASNVAVASEITPVTASKYIVTAGFDITAPSIAADKNGAPLTYSAGAPPAGTVFSNRKMRLGATLGSAFRLSGDIYSFVLIASSLLPDERALLRAYADSKTGDAQVPPPAFPAGSTVDTLIVTGQSNAEGRGVAAESPTVTAGVAGIYSGGGINQLLSDPVGQAVTGSAWPAYANAWYAATGRRILVIEAATGGSGLMPGVGSGDWSPSGTLRAAAVAAANAATTKLSTMSVVSGNVHLYWQQGEQDATVGVAAADYQSAQESLFTYFFANITGLSRILVSELGEAVPTNANYAVIRGAQNAAVAATLNCHLAFNGAKNFPAQGKMKDGVHYTQAGLNELGAAVANYNFGLGV